MIDIFFFMKARTKKISLIATAILVVCIVSIFAFGYFSRRNLKSSFVGNKSVGQNAVTYSFYQGTYISNNQAIVSIKLLNGGGIFTGFKITSETKVVRLSSNGNRGAHEELKTIEDIPKGAALTIMTSNRNAESLYQALKITYQ